MTLPHEPAPSPSPSEREARRARVAQLKAAMRERVLVLDGAMGTMLQDRNLKAADFGGPEYKGCSRSRRSRPRSST
mgnify:CR=1 FL=1